MSLYSLASASAAAAYMNASSSSTASEPQLTPQSGVSMTHYTEIQNARCLVAKYAQLSLPRCTACIAKRTGDTCRFLNLRILVKDKLGNCVGYAFTRTHPSAGPAMDYPTKWNRRLETSHIYRTKKTVARVLLPVLKREMEHISHPDILSRPRETDLRATCDICMTSLFSGSWMCRTCGREACGDCFDKIQELTAANASKSYKTTKWKRNDHQRRWLACVVREQHTPSHFSPMSRFNAKELSKTIEDMQMILEEQKVADDFPPDADLRSKVGGFEMNDNDPYGGLPSPLTDYGSSPPPSALDQGSQLYQPPFLSDITLSTPSWPIRRYPDSVLTTETFPAIWSTGQPLLVTGVLQKMSIRWTPEYFIEEYGFKKCYIVECHTGTHMPVTVEEFFSRFGNYEDRKVTWKLKDWPPSMDFKTAFPELYEDFSQAVPVPDYVRRDGVLNISSHFPTNTVVPDLGPKMYNAMGSTLSVGSKGSTRLHMDMADALNIMTYAAPCPDGSPGCAAWDLFRPEDSHLIRTFLKSRFSPLQDYGDMGADEMFPPAVNGNGGKKAKTNGAANGYMGWEGMHDPIHGQQFYLDEQLMADLYREHGVKSYRVYQRPGEAIFIPAGCAHQVANLSDCIKVAVDFVSPENVERCERLTREFREGNEKKAWKEDVLQLRTMMWFSWLSCCQQEERLAAEEERKMDVDTKAE